MSAKCERISVGWCPTCGTALDSEEVMISKDWFEAFCCHCGRYVRKRRTSISVADRITEAPAA